MHKKIILIVDDNKVNRDVLENLLEYEYDVLLAVDGREAHSVLKRRYDDIAAVILDIIMPEMNGYELLRLMMADDRLASIPVIAMTVNDSAEDEAKAFEYGAVDYITKPINPLVVRQRLKNAIQMSKVSDTVSVIKKDRLTGLYNKDTFMHIMEDILLSSDSDRYDLIVADIIGIRVIYETFGSKENDKLICDVAEEFRFVSGKVQSYCASEGDKFYILVSRNASFVENMIREIKKFTSEYPLGKKITIKYGIYEINDNTMSVDDIEDKALYALNCAKRVRDKIYCYYEEVEEQERTEQKIINDFDRALEEDQIKVYFQPKFDIINNKIIGSEALVRWEHPELGMLMPNQFIPLVTDYGLITRLNKVVWKRSCYLMASWIAEGIDVVPVSVNFSRRDLYSHNIIKYIAKLLDNYGLGRDMLHLEIAEEAYIRNTEQVEIIINEAHAAGLSIEMDGLGENFSIFNIIHRLPIDVIKLSVDSINDSKNMLEMISFVRNIVEDMNIKVLAERVETKEQEEQIKAAGCHLTQGFLYEIPLSGEEYKKRLINNE